LLTLSLYFLKVSCYKEKRCVCDSIEVSVILPNSPI
jgi:hypothetical protein